MCTRSIARCTRARWSWTRVRRPTFAMAFVPGTINIPLNASFTTWAGWTVPFTADFI